MVRLLNYWYCIDRVYFELPERGSVKSVKNKLTRFFFKINVLNYSMVSNNCGIVPSVALATDCRSLLTRDVLRHKQNRVSVNF